MSSSQLPWIVWPSFVLLAMLALGRWAKTSHGEVSPSPASARGRIQTALSATTTSRFSMATSSLAIVLLVGAAIFQNFWLVSAGVTVATIGLVTDFALALFRKPVAALEREQ